MFEEFICNYGNLNITIDDNQYTCVLTTHIYGKIESTGNAGIPKTG